MRVNFSKSYRNYIMFDNESTFCCVCFEAVRIKERLVSKAYKRFLYRQERGE